MNQLYALHDSSPLLKTRGAFLIDEKDADRLNDDGYGIFWSVQTFIGARKKENLKRINAWAIDIDDSTKRGMRKLINSGLVPSSIVESKRGYHVYWFAKDAQAKNYKPIVADRLVPYYGADANAKDLCRILRAPGYMHMKDPEDPFEIKVVWEKPVFYTERQMFYFYAPPNIHADKSEHARLNKAFPEHGDLFEKVYNLDCKDALLSLSEHKLLRGERYSFRENANGTHQILVNEKSTSCWIDPGGKIGSMDKGGPTVWQWIYWYLKDHKLTYRLISETFPEVVK